MSTPPRETTWNKGSKGETPIMFPAPQAAAAAAWESGRWPEKNAAFIGVIPFLLRTYYNLYIRTGTGGAILFPPLFCAFFAWNVFGEVSSHTLPFSCYTGALIANIVNNCDFLSSTTLGRENR